MGVEPAYGSSFSTSSAMMSLQSPMHSSQMYTVGPAMSFFTSFCDFPQKEHLRLLLWSSATSAMSRSAAAGDISAASSSPLSGVAGGGWPASGPDSVSTSSAMLSLQSSMQTSHMQTFGPAMSR